MGTNLISLKLADYKLKLALTIGDETCFPELKAFISLLPSEEATSGVALSILRLQSVFGLDARDMASGLIREHRYETFTCFLHKMCSTCRILIDLLEA